MANNRIESVKQQRRSCMEKLLTVKEVAEALQINPEIVRRKVRSGEMRAYKVGKGWRFAKEDIKKFLEKCLS